MFVSDELASREVYKASPLFVCKYCMAHSLTTAVANRGEHRMSKTRPFVKVYSFCMWQNRKHFIIYQIYTCPRVLFCSDSCCGSISQDDLLFIYYEIVVLDRKFKFCMQLDVAKF